MNTSENKSIKIWILIFLFSNLLVAQDPTVGLIYQDANKIYEGYTLFSPKTSNTTYLIDSEGLLVNQWESEFVPGLSVYLLEDGHLLRSGAIENPDENPTGGFQKFDWDNNLVWQYYYGRQHHDIEPLPNGNVLMVVNDRKTRNEAIQAGRDPNLISGNNIRSLAILEVRQTGPETGEIVWEWKAWDHLVQDHDNTKDNFGVVSEHPELMNINYAKDGGQDWLHTNSVAYNEALDQIIVSNRNTNEIWIIDHSTTTEEAATHTGGNSGKGGDILYRWGNPIAYQAGNESNQKLFGQHDAHWIKSGLPGEGNIMIFSNGISNRGYSSVDEIVPPVDSNGNYTLASGAAFEPLDPVWQFTKNEPEDFYSPRYGGSQRLPNGNTLICNSDSGEFFEVTPEKEIVWVYINPVATDKIYSQGDTDIDNNQVFRCYRYGADYVGLAGQDLTPGDPIELYPNVAIQNENSIIENFKLHNNHPNPFNPNTKIEFSLSHQNDVSLIIYDILGNKIRTLIEYSLYEEGLHQVYWDSLNDDGKPTVSGIYFYTLKTKDKQQTKKMMLLH